MRPMKETLIYGDGYSQPIISIIWQNTVAGVNILIPGVTPQEVFRHYTNLVADFEISLIRKAIDQTKENSPARNIPFNILSN